MHVILALSVPSWLLLIFAPAITASLQHNTDNSVFLDGAYGARSKNELRCPDNTNGTFCENNNFCCPGGYHCVAQNPTCFACVPDESTNPFLFDTEAYRVCNSSDTRTVQTLAFEVQIPLVSVHT